MRALICRELGSPGSLSLEEVDDPVAGDRQVLIDVHACAVNFPDLLMVQGKYQFKPPMPFSPGGEVAGVVAAVGADVEGFGVGDRVIASPRWGGLAERVAVGVDSVLSVPDGMDLLEASAFLYAYGTSHYALTDRAQLRPGEHLVVLGAAGGVGLAAVELGAAMGANVIAAASSPAKLEVCRRHGAAATIDYSVEDLKERIRELTGGRGADVVYDAVGGRFSEAALRATAWGGRFLVVGFATGSIPAPPLNLVLLKSCSVVGVFWGAFVAREPAAHRRNVAELVRMWRAGDLRGEVSATYPLARGAEAIERLASRQAVGKVVVQVRPDQTGTRGPA